MHFREIGGATWPRRSGTAKGARGSITFTPAFGKGGARKIVAIVEQRGYPRTQLDVAALPRGRSAHARRSAGA